MKPETFFSDIGNDSPYMKVGLEGEGGSGKSRTATEIAIGIHKEIKSTKPIVFFDTEKASRFFTGILAGHGIKGVVKESRQLIDLITTINLCKEGASDILIIDSLTHVWREFVAAYMAKSYPNQQRNPSIRDWGILKPKWHSDFSDPYVYSYINIIFTGRAGYEYDHIRNSAGEITEIVKTGVKMKVESDTAYEPDLLILMNRYEKFKDDTVKDVWREATIIKDRLSVIDGQVFKNPSWLDFKPYWDALVNGSIPQRPMKEGDTKQLFGDPDNPQYREQRDILLEEIKGEFEKVFGEARSAEDKKAKSRITEDAFQTVSITKISNMSLEQLEFGKARVIELIQEHMKSKEGTKTDGNN